MGRGRAEHGVRQCALACALAVPPAGTLPQSSSDSVTQRQHSCTIESQLKVIGVALSKRMTLCAGF